MSVLLEVFLTAGFLSSIPIEHGNRFEEKDVPGRYGSIQEAIDASQPGDTILLSPGRYQERIRLKPGIKIRSKGDDQIGERGLLRAEKTILDGGGDNGKKPGVIMAEGCVLDGITVTKVGVYDDEVWRKHHATQGEDLGDHEGAVQAEVTVAAIQIAGVNCTVKNSIVHHNGDVGIAVMGSKNKTVLAVVLGNTSYRNMGAGIGVADGSMATIQKNICSENLRAGIGCRDSNPMILDNHCFKNIRAGIGCREKSGAVIRGNRCHENRRAGIGIRMPGTAPIVEQNHCYENSMAGIGSRDGSAPIIRHNVCLKNQMAGIGSEGSRPILIENQCRDNRMAGIGMKEGSTVLVVGNQCAGNRLVAIGVTGQSNAVLLRNKLSRVGGMPPLVAVKDGSAALIQDNFLNGGGVAAVLVQGKVIIRDNRFQGQSKKQGNAVWVWKDSEVNVTQNEFSGYRAAVHATQAKVVVRENLVEGYAKSAIVVMDGIAPSLVVGNTAISKEVKEDSFLITPKIDAARFNSVKTAK
jgi:hypothetical protein